MSDVNGYEVARQYTALDAMVSMGSTLPRLHDLNASWPYSSFLDETQR